MNVLDSVIKGKSISKALSDAGSNLVNKNPLSLRGLGITLTNNEVKDIIKVISTSENRGILLKGTIKKFSSQEELFL